MSRRGWFAAIAAALGLGKRQVLCGATVLVPGPRACFKLAPTTALVELPDYVRKYMAQVNAGAVEMVRLQRKIDDAGKRQLEIFSTYVTPNREVG